MTSLFPVGIDQVQILINKTFYVHHIFYYAFGTAVRTRTGVFVFLVSKAHALHPTRLVVLEGKPFVGWVLITHIKIKKYRNI